MPRFHGSQNRRGIPHSAVDFPAGMVAPQGGDNLGERASLHRQNIEQRHEGRNGIVGDQVVVEPKIRVSREFAGENCPGLPHMRFDERMADPAHLGPTAGLLDFLGDRPARTKIV